MKVHRASRSRVGVCGVLAAFAVGPACAGTTPLPRGTRVDREERVRVGDPDHDAFFAQLHGLQVVLGTMELARDRARVALARGLGLRADADRAAIAQALTLRVAGTGSPRALGFGAELPVERHADALEAWRAALGDEVRQREAFGALMARARVQVITDRRCVELAVVLREASTLTRLALAQHAVTGPLARVAGSLTAIAEAQSRVAPTPWRAEYIAAQRWLESVPVRLALQSQAAEESVLWIRGVLHPEAGERHDVQEIGCPLP